MNQRHGSGPCFPCECPAVPTLLEVKVIVRIGDADPAYKRRLDSFARAIGKIQVANALRRQEPFVACSSRDVDKLCLNIYWNRAECLNSVYDE